MSEETKPPLMTETEQLAHSRVVHAAEDYSRALGRRLQSTGAVDIMQMFLTVSLQQAQVEVLLTCMTELFPTFRENFWLKMSDQFDAMTAQLLKELIITPTPVRKQ